MLDSEAHSFRSPFRSNQYPSRCRYCRDGVPARQGSLVGQDNKGWVVAHNKCVPDDIWAAAADGAQWKRDNMPD